MIRYVTSRRPVWSLPAVLDAAVLDAVVDAAVVDAAVPAEPATEADEPDPLAPRSANELESIGAAEYAEVGAYEVGGR
jgi:hypothetical protein